MNSSSPKYRQFLFRIYSTPTHETFLSFRRWRFEMKLSPFFIQLNDGWTLLFYSCLVLLLQKMSILNSKVCLVYALFDVNHYKKWLDFVQAVVPAPKKCPMFSSESIYAGIFNLKTIQFQNDLCKRKETPQNGKQNRSSFVLLHLDRSEQPSIFCRDSSSVKIILNFVTVWILTNFSKKIFYL
jgi:hypothetical protein